MARVATLLFCCLAARAVATVATTGLEDGEWYAVADVGRGDDGPALVTFAPAPDISTVRLWFTQPGRYGAPGRTSAIMVNEVRCRAREGGL